MTRKINQKRSERRCGNNDQCVPFRVYIYDGGGMGQHGDGGRQCDTMRATHKSNQQAWPHAWP
jgi:hypothetical protein